jgi:hypothetical protein
MTSQAQSNGKDAYFKAIGLLLLSIIVMVGFDIWRAGRTFYAPGYSDSRFAMLREGMTEQEVERIVGPPLKKVVWENEDVLWAYSARRDVSLSYNMRDVVFRNKRVISVTSQWWQE